jgi:hypothetical protein
MVSFEELIRGGMELMVSIRGQGRLAVIRLITINCKHFLHIDYRGQVANLPNIIQFQVVDITTIIRSELSNYFLHIFRCDGDTIRIRFPSLFSRDTFSVQLEKWLKYVGVNVKILDSV